MTDNRDKDHIDGLLAQGIWMGDDGPKSWALTIEQVRSILAVARTLDVPLLGGDVWEFSAGQFSPACMNWHSNPRIGEAHEDFVTRSVDEASAYLDTIEHISKNYMYVLVFERLRPV